MALSNWDTLAFNMAGACVGHETNHQGATIDIYKNWLYLRHGEDQDNVEVQVTEGRLHWRSWEIDARRGPQDGVFVVAHSHRWDTKTSPPGQVDQRILVGCGVYGYDDFAERDRELVVAAGFDPDDEEVVFWTVGCLDEAGEPSNRLEVITGGERRVIADGLPDPGWIGVTAESVAFLKAMVADHTRDGRWEKPSLFWPGMAYLQIDWDGALRANQGDMFFAGNVGFDVPATPVGESEDPLMLQMLSSSTPVEDHAEDGDDREEHEVAD
jgi:hypothetical protein